MAKFKKSLSKKEQENLFIEFAKAIGTLKNPEEIARFVQDLLSKQEIFMLARRLQIARLLYEGYTYQQIREALRVGLATIARVQTWMQLYGDGYRTVLERTKKKEPEPYKRSSWKQLQRRYPQYFWPQLLLEEIVRSANLKQKERLLKILNQVNEKTALSKELAQILNSTDL